MANVMFAFDSLKEVSFPHRFASISDDSYQLG